MAFLKLKIIACGGTIDKVYFDAKSAFQVGEPQVVTVLRESNVTLEYEVESVLKKDSLDMTDADRELVRSVVEASAESRILITHGTDTMIQTAKALSNISNKTIVFTGSMEPAKFKVTDAAFNIGCAIAAVQILPAGVYLAMNGKILDPNRAIKNIIINRFEEV
jgi:L-asparaginase